MFSLTQFCDIRNFSFGFAAIHHFLGFENNATDKLSGRIFTLLLQCLDKQNYCSENAHRKDGSSSNFPHCLESLILLCSFLPKLHKIVAVIFKPTLFQLLSFSSTTASIENPWKLFFAIEVNIFQPRLWSEGKKIESTRASLPFMKARKHTFMKDIFRCCYEKRKYEKDES